MPEEQILENDQLLRRFYVHERDGHILNGRITPTVFYDRHTGDPDSTCSVYTERLMRDDREWCVRKQVFKRMNVLAVRARIPMARGATVTHRPNEQYSHTEILSLTRAACTAMARGCQRLDSEVEDCLPIGAKS